MEQKKTALTSPNKVDMMNVWAHSCLATHPADTEPHLCSFGLVAVFLCPPTSSSKIKIKVS